MFVHATTVDNRHIAINPLAIAVIVEKDGNQTAIETTDGSEYIVAESFTDIKVKLETAIKNYRQNTAALRR